MNKFCNLPALALVLLLGQASLLQADPRIRRAVSQSNRGYQCGERKRQVEGLITNGVNTKLGDWPWHGGLFHHKNRLSKEYKCGATLIHQNYVITASHCVVDRESGYELRARSVTVDFGTVRLHSPSSHLQTHKVAEITVHPEFNKDTNKHDVALLTLETAVTFSEFVLPICLGLSKSDTRIHDIVGGQGVVVGWGLTEQDETSSELKIARLPIVDYDECLETDADLFGKLIYPGMFCAGFRNGTSVCNGDSGGGLYVSNGNRWILRGITSFSAPREGGSEKCDVNHLAAFMNVQYYVPWIQQQVSDLPNDVPSTTTTTTTTTTARPTRPQQEPSRESACTPNPCGTGATCNESRFGRAICTCPAGGNPYTSCRSTECHPGACGENANCMSRNGFLTCSCPQNMIGDPYIQCRPLPHRVQQESSYSNCNPNPCGRGANCQVNNRGVPVCSCPSGYHGHPYTSCERGDCLENNECRLDQLCHMGNCVNPCQGACGVNAQCGVRNHRAVCSCPPNTDGNPLERCSSSRPNQSGFTVVTHEWHSETHNSGFF